MDKQYTPNNYSVVGKAFSATIKFMTFITCIMALAFVFEFGVARLGLMSLIETELPIASLISKIEAETSNPADIGVGLAGMFVTFAGVVFAINLVVKYKYKKRLELEQKADNAIEYAEKSDEYRRNEVAFDTGTDKTSHKDTFSNKSETLDEGISEEYAAEYQQSKGTNGNAKFKLRLKKSSIVKIVLIGAVVLLYVFPKLPALLKSGALAENLALMSQVIPTIAVVGVVIFLINRKKSSRLKSDSVIYTKLIPDEIKKAFGENSSFDKTRGLSGNEIVRINCFKDGITNIIGGGLICGRYKNVEFSSAHEVVKGQYIDDDGDKREYTQFNGLMVSLPYPKSSEFRLGLRSNSREDIVKLIEKKKRTLSRVSSEISGTESADFNTLFTIKSDDEENLYYILTPHVMEKIAALYKYTISPKPQPVYAEGNTNTQNIVECINAIYQSGIYKGLYLYFECGRMYLGLSAKRSFMEFQRVSPTNEELAKLQNSITAELDEVRKLLDFALSLY